MSTDNPDHRLSEKLKQQLDQTEAELDNATLEALRVSRQQALTAPRHVAWKVPSAAFASLVFGALLVSSVMVSSEAPVPVALFEDMALLSTDESLEMYEDIDLILWLLAEESGSDLG